MVLTLNTFIVVAGQTDDQNGLPFGLNTIVMPDPKGVIHFIPIETFANPGRGLDRGARTEVEFSFFNFDSSPPTTSDWPKINDPILREGYFVLETSMPAFRATLRFCPERPTDGDYEIHRIPRGGQQKGRTEKVTKVPTSENYYWLKMLAPFSTRFAVVTVGSDRPHTSMMWLVGLNEYRCVEL